MLQTWLLYVMWCVSCVVRCVQGPHSHRDRGQERSCNTGHLPGKYEEDVERTDSRVRTHWGLKAAKINRCYVCYVKVTFDLQGEDHWQLNSSTVSHRQRGGRGVLSVRPALLGHRRGRGHHQRGGRMRHRHQRSAHVALDVIKRV